MEYYYHVRSRLDHHVIFPLYSIIWRLESRNPPRIKPLEVLALGPSRSGTDSLRLALKELGYEDTYHGLLTVERQQKDAQTWCKLLVRKYCTRKLGEIEPEPIKIPRETFESILSGCTAVTDGFPSYFGPELIKAYPNAKVILNRRDVDAWDKSMRENTVVLASLWIPWFIGFFNAEMFWLHRLARYTYLMQYFGDNAANRKRGFVEHFDRLEAILSKKNYLKWSVEDGWEPLCKFLNKPVPDKPFPHSNSLAEYHKRNDEYFEGYGKIALTNVMHLSIACAIGVALGRAFYET